MNTRFLLLGTFASLVLFASSSRAQQPAPEQQRQDDTPTLTTDDVPTAPIAGQPAGAQTEEPAADDSALTPEEKADAAASKNGTAPTARAGTKKGPSRAELAWRGRYAEATTRMQETRQRAQEAELRLTELRNSLGTTRTTQDRNAVAASLEQQGQILESARREAAEAASALKAVAAEGAANNFSAASAPAPTTRGGAPNAAYFRSQVSQAQADLDDADRRLKIYQDRVSDARARILNNSGSGDNFAQMKIQEELDAALSELENAQADRDAAAQKVDAARQAAQNANVAVPEP